MTMVQIQWQHLLNHSICGDLTAELPLRIGRSPHNHLVLIDRLKSISRHHATLLQEQGQIVLRDEQSMNGVVVNGRHRTQTLITENLTFIIGAYELTVTIQQQCSNPACSRMIASHQAMCPWCGRFTAVAITREGVLG